MKKTTSTFNQSLLQAKNHYLPIHFELNFLSSKFKIIACSVLSFGVIIPNKDKIGLQLKYSVVCFWENQVMEFLKSNFGGATIYNGQGIYLNMQEDIRLFHVEVFEQSLHNFQNLFDQLLAILQEFQFHCNQDSIGLFLNHKFYAIRFIEID